MSSLAHQVILQRLRQAQRDHAAAIRDICLLPEIEMHLRSQGTTPYELARDDAKYPFARMLAVAELASNLDEQALPELQPMLADPDSAIRYWAALGHLMRGRTAVAGQEAQLRTLLVDPSPQVRIVAAQALVQWGTAADLVPALAVLGELAPPQTNGVLVAMSALDAIDALGPRATALRDLVRTMNPQGPSPDERFNYPIPNLIKSIASH